MSSRSYTTGGGGGTPIQIFFQVVNADEIKAAIASIAAEFPKVDAAVAKTGQGMQQVGTNIKADGGSASSLTPISTNLDKVKTSSDNTTHQLQN